MLVRRNKMKRTVMLTTIVLLAAGVAYFALAAEHPGAMMGKAEGKMMGKGMMGCPLHTMKCGHLMKAEISTTPDGGVVVLCCNKLYKYDKDLNFVKSVEMKEVEQDCKTMMEQMRKECVEKCPMMKMEKPAGE